MRWFRDASQRERRPDENDAALCAREPLLPRPPRAGAADDEPEEPEPEPLPREPGWL